LIIFAILMTSLEVDLCCKRQPMQNGVEEDRTLFFRRFLNTPEEMDAHLGFRGTHWRAPGLLEA
jgi:hypothetical protein